MFVEKNNNDFLRWKLKIFYLVNSAKQFLWPSCYVVENHQYQSFKFARSLRKHPFLLALRRRGHFARRNVCDSAAEILY